MSGIKNSSGSFEDLKTSEKETVLHSEKSKEYYQQHEDEVIRTFKVDIDTGLSDAQVKENFGKFGANNLGNEATISYSKILAHQVFNAMIMVLLISMIIALAIKDWISGGVIAGVVGINIIVGFIQEVKAEKTMGSLRSLSSPMARVLRNGVESNINTDEVVPGDIIHISVGDTVPADLRLIECTNLETDEALLTGESLPVAKDPQVIEGECPVGDRINLAFSSSVVAKGRGVGIVVDTGLSTEIGKIAASLQNSEDKLIVKPTPGSGIIGFVKAFGKSTLNIILNVLGTNVGTPLQRRLSWLAILLFWVAVLFAIVVMASQTFRVNKSVAIYAICVALSMIPSSLVVVLTITMAIGSQVMVTKNVIVRKLDSLEALGGINDICSDKTGTLTLGKMIARKIWIPTVGTYLVTNSNDVLDPEDGEISFNKSSPYFIKQSDEESDFIPNYPLANNFRGWLETATLANIAKVIKNEEGWEAHGDATEIAINVFTQRVDYSRDNYIEKYSLEHIEEFPFDSSIKRMSAIYKNSKTGESKVYTKGAVERLLTICTHWHGEDQDNEQLIPLTQEDRESIENNMNALSSEGLRVLAFATRGISEKEEYKRELVEQNLTFQGLIGIYDPPRPETAGSVKACHKAGINVHMLTGDHPGTAKAIAQEVGIIPHNLYHYADDVVRAMVMTASEFDKLSDEEVDNLPVLPLVIARCAPQTKVRMIEALHRRNKFCAMTGDGVNDSPSLKKADVGIAMGMNGSDVAKDASDIILTDDNFSSILNAIEEGRRMSSNIQKFVLQLLAENVAQAFYLMIGLAFIDDDSYSVFPLSPVECLWIIVVTSCFPAMGLGQEKASDDILTLPPNKTIFTWEVMVDMVVYGTWMASCNLACYSLIVFEIGNGFLGSGCNESNGTGCNLVFRGRAAAFSCFTWCAVLLAWECIHLRNSLFNMRPNSELSWYKSLSKDLWDNKFLFFSIIFAILSVFPVVYIPVINDKVFLHAPIGYEWGLSVAFTVLFMMGAELWKFVKRCYYRSQAAKNPDHELEKNDPFQKYVTMSRSNTLVV
ncbi:sodium transport ATPase 2 [[Candida] jaroonii]|uniref:Sodium transport ATPase 2 n=1 Tax=[Candida] jaroonii TaxID=467808 RepID=A0ACA9YCM0_9ASCO|nr:sodium transport ATPase 2 [[Candida] jaroonii]